MAKKKLKKLVVMDFTDNSINIYDYDESKWEQPEDFTVKDVYIINSNCYYMVTNKVKINML